MPKTVKLSVLIVVEPDGDGFHAYCPGLKGLHTCGSTREEALSNAQDAAEAYLISLVKHGEPVPVGTGICVEDEPDKDFTMRELVVAAA